MHHAPVDYRVVLRRNDVTYLHDLDQGRRSVTNRAELVVSEIARDHPEDRIIYRDTMGNWAELRHCRGTFFGFRIFSEAEQLREIPDELRQQPRHR